MNNNNRPIISNNFPHNKEINLQLTILAFNSLFYVFSLSNQCMDNNNYKLFNRIINLKKFLLQEIIKINILCLIIKLKFRNKKFKK